VYVTMRSGGVCVAPAHPNRQVYARRPPGGWLERPVSQCGTSVLWSATRHRKAAARTPYLPPQVASPRFLTSHRRTLLPPGFGRVSELRLLWTVRPVHTRGRWARSRVEVTRGGARHPHAPVQAISSLKAVDDEVESTVDRVELNVARRAQPTECKTNPSARLRDAKPPLSRSCL
jgi:hypothetical protein